jgi:cytochrome c biogenesis protein CcmG/thiol:disulfide interchange protein DsbE
MQLMKSNMDTGALAGWRCLLVSLLLVAFVAVPGCGGEERDEAVAEQATEQPAEAVAETPGPAEDVKAADEAGEQAAVEPVVAQHGEDPFAGFPNVELPELLPVAQRVPLPRFSMRDMNGREIASDDLSGQVVLLNFWATWCRPCKMEVPALVYLHKTYADAGLQIIAPSIDRTGLAVVKPFLDQRPEIKYTVVPNGMPAAQAFGGIRSIPTSFLVDKQGRVVKAFQGLVPQEVLEGYIQSALREEA